MTRMSEDCTGAPMKKKAKITDEVDEGDVRKEQKQNEEQSPLLQVNDDVLLLLFSHLLHLVDALHLGSTCRRLYGFYLKSCTDRRSLEICRSTNAYDIRLNHTFEATAADELTKDNHCLVALPDLDRTNANSITTFFTQLFACLPNLVSLEVVDENESKWTLSPLFTALRSSPLFSGRLQALTLAIDEEKQVDKKTLEPLHLPALKHLTLYIGNDGQEPVKVVLNSPLFDWVLPQLASFRLYAESGNLVEMLQFIDEHFLRLANAHLTTAAASIDASSSPSLQIALDLPDDAINNYLWSPHEHRQALACVTSLVINTFEEERKEEEEDNLHLQMLPLLANLKKVRISQYSFDAKWYYEVLTALAKLPKLEEVAVKMLGDVPRWAQQLMPTLPTVRSLSLELRSTKHANPVEVFHLSHCFPNLQQISVLFEQYNCEFCDYRLAADGDLGVFQKCALRMACDLQRLGTGTGWQAQVKLKKLMTCFRKPKVQFSSLENLLAGIKDFNYQGWQW